MANDRYHFSLWAKRHHVSIEYTSDDDTDVHFWMCDVYKAVRQYYHPEDIEGYVSMDDFYERVNANRAEFEALFESFDGRDGFGEARQIELAFGDGVHTTLTDEWRSNWHWVVEHSKDTPEDEDEDEEDAKPKREEINLFNYQEFN